MDGAPTSNAPRLAAFHDAGTAAGRDHVVALAADGGERAAAFGHDAAEAARLVVPVRHARRAVRVAVRLPDAGAAQDDDRRPHTPLAQPLVGLGELEQEANALHGVAQDEIRIRGGQTIGG
jgi:hypothetical protein